jgi:hypothetical protein
MIAKRYVQKFICIIKTKKQNPKSAMFARERERVLASERVSE